MTEPADDPQALRSRMRADLTAAMKARQPDAVAALRLVLASFDNAEAVPHRRRWGAGDQRVRRRDQRGAGLREVARRELTLDDLYAVLRAQIDERAADALDDLRHDIAAGPRSVTVCDRRGRTSSRAGTGPGRCGPARSSSRTARPAGSRALIFTLLLGGHFGRDLDITISALPA